MKICKTLFHVDVHISSWILRDKTKDENFIIKYFPLQNNSTFNKVKVVKYPGDYTVFYAKGFREKR